MKFKMIRYFIVAIFFSVTLYARTPLSIIPKTGTIFPIEMISGYNVQAFYTIINNTTLTLSDMYISKLPLNVQQVTTGGLYPDTCGATFSLAPGATATLQLNISGPVDPLELNNHFLVCLSGGRVGVGTSSPLDVVETSWLPISVSYEIIYSEDALTAPTSFLQTYKEGGTNPINEEEWQAYEPPAGYTKNNTRHLQFNESLYIGSPGCQNGTTLYITTEGGTPSDGYTWGEISNVINAMWPYAEVDYPDTDGSPFVAGNEIDSPVAGGVKVTANYKSQKMKFFACENDFSPDTPGAVPILRYFITDQWGNRYIMHASDYANPAGVTAAFQAARLPIGWTKQMEYLTEDFILYPAQGVNNTFEYNLIRDNENNTYHQMYWSPTGATTVTSQIQGQGMPIWGGLSNDTLTMNNGYDNIIYGGGGANTFVFPALNNLSAANVGTNTIMGFNPITGDLINIEGQTYTYLLTPYGISITVQSGLVILLSGIFTFDTDWIVS